MLWFIVYSTPGLVDHFVIVQELLWFIKIEYIFGRTSPTVIVQELLWFILLKSVSQVTLAAVIVQELLWFIPCKIKVCIFSIA